MKKLNSINIDKIGICTSTICILHCLAIPALIILGLDSMLWIIDNQWAVVLIIGSSLVVGFVSFLSGYWVHRQHFLPVLFLSGFLLIVNGESVSSEWLGIILSVIGAGIIIYAHFHNNKLKRHAASV